MSSAKGRATTAPTTMLRAAEVDAVIFDLDGVMTRTAAVHARAWKAVFDAYLEMLDTDQAPFDIEVDYYRHVDGKPRYEGVEGFLKSRGIDLPYGEPDDPPEAETVCGLGNRKNTRFRELLDSEGVTLYKGAVALVRRLRAQGIRTAIVSASKNCKAVVEAAGLAELFDVRVDGIDAARLGLPGKPDPAMFVEAARQLDTTPGRSAVVEDALAGVEAARSGGFARVIGVDRGGHRQALLAHGADTVVGELAELAVDPAPAEHCRSRIAERLTTGSLAVFVDFDGTLTPIVPTPDEATLAQAMREALARLAVSCPVAIISGRDLTDVRQRVGLDQLFYAGSHGFDIAGPTNWHKTLQQGTTHLDALDEAEQRLRERIGPIAGALVERKRFSIAVHYRNVADGEVERVRGAVEEAVAGLDGLRLGTGKKVLEIQPDIDWDKGHAVNWLLEALELDPDKVIPIYIGDDVTDEDAFAALSGRGLSLVVADPPRPSRADCVLSSPDAVRVFLDELADLLKA